MRLQGWRACIPPALFRSPALLLHSGPSRSPTLGRAVASSRHCQPMGPKELQARGRPRANLPNCELEPKTSPSKNDQKTNKKQSPNNNQKNQQRFKTIEAKSPKNRPDWSAIRKYQAPSTRRFFPTLAPSQDHRQPPSCSPEGPTIGVAAGQCSSSVAASSMAGKTAH